MYCVGTRLLEVGDMGNSAWTVRTGQGRGRAAVFGGAIAVTGVSGYRIRENACAGDYFGTTGCGRDDAVCRGQRASGRIWTE
jgi:hypothetical protein